MRTQESCWRLNGVTSGKGATSYGGIKKQRNPGRKREIQSSVVQIKMIYSHILLLPWPRILHDYRLTASCFINCIFVWKHEFADFKDFIDDMFLRSIYHTISLCLL